MLVAKLELHETDVVAVFDLQVGRIGTAKRMQVQPGREPEFVDEGAHALPQIALGHQPALLGGEHVVDGPAVAGKSALGPVREGFSGPVEYGQHGALFGRRPAHGLAVAHPHQAPFTKERGPGVTREVDQL
jgi:hypothetical protein